MMNKHVILISLVALMCSYGSVANACYLSPPDIELVEPTGDAATDVPVETQAEIDDVRLLGLDVDNDGIRGDSNDVTGVLIPVMNMWTNTYGRSKAYVATSELPEVRHK